MAQKIPTPVFDERDIQDNKVVCAISYLWILFFLPLVACKDSPFGKFTANQAILLFLASVAFSIVGIIPILGTIISFVGGIAVFVLAIIQIVSTLQGKPKALPFIGNIIIFK